jgi:hypothetical protein
VLRQGGGIVPNGRGLTVALFGGKEEIGEVTWPANDMPPTSMISACCDQPEIDFRCRPGLRRLNASSIRHVAIVVTE